MHTAGLGHEKAAFRVEILTETIGQTLLCFWRSPLPHQHRRSQTWRYQNVSDVLTVLIPGFAAG